MSIRKTTSKNIQSRIFVFYLLLSYLHQSTSILHILFSSSNFISFFPVWIEEESPRGGEHDVEQ